MDSVADENCGINLYQELSSLSGKINVNSRESYQIQQKFRRKYLRRYKKIKSIYQKNIRHQQKYLDYIELQRKINSKTTVQQLKYSFHTQSRTCLKRCRHFLIYVGFFALYITKSTVFMQDFWMPGIDEDKELKEEYENGTIKQLQDSNEFPHIKVPRCLAPSGERGSF